MQENISYRREVKGKLWMKGREILATLQQA